MSETLSRYACDTCRSRKVACSREASCCQRCKDEDITCTYSRSGVIRRNRKRKRELPESSPSTATLDHGSSRPEESRVQSHLANDIEVTRDQLHGLDTTQHNTMGALTVLSEACAAIWHDAAEFDKNSKDYFLFEEQAPAWVAVFTKTLQRGYPLFSSAPAEVLDLLRACRPHHIRERAWLVMYYSIVLSMVSSTNPDDTSTKAKLRCNLWLALNDVRILLEPTEPNILALALLATHVEEFTMPSLCWMLVTNACRMLQALGINHRRLDSGTRQRRTMMFWYLNLIDKGLALAFGRPPTFHRAMARELELPSLDQLLPFQPHLTKAGTHALFGAHYIHQNMLKSRVTADIWYCLYEEAVPNERNIQAVTQDLESWFKQSKRILEATAIAEKPFLDAAGIASVDLGLCMNCFIYHYLKVLLTRSFPHMKSQCIDSSQQMLHLLQHMVSDSEEPYNGIVWQLVCNPFTPFLVLFGEILSVENRQSPDTQYALAAMEELPLFLSKMSLRNSLAAKLEPVAMVFMQHARSVVNPQAPQPHQTAIDSWPDMSQWNSFFNVAGYNYDFLEDPVFDWIAWDSNGL